MIVLTLDLVPSGLANVWPRILNDDVGRGFEEFK